MSLPLLAAALLLLLLLVVVLDAVDEAYPPSPPHLGAEPFFLLSFGAGVPAEEEDVELDVMTEPTTPGPNAFRISRLGFTL